MRQASIVQNKQAGRILTAYGRKKLLSYADSFRSLANAFQQTRVLERGNQSDIQQSEATEMKAEWWQREIEKRQEKILLRRLCENQEIWAEHLTEIANIISNVVEESYQIQMLEERELKKLTHACKQHGILIRNAGWLTDEENGKRFSAELCVDEKHVLTIEEVANFLSVYFDERLLPEKDSLFFLSKEYEVVLFEQETRYSILTGAAKATRENETVSGDTYSFIEKGNGNLLMALSDGMGSGEKAMEDSENVIDLFEKLVEAGFSKEIAAEMINGVLLAKAEEENMSTLDLCDINLYTGACELIKIGASYTFIKRDNLVEMVCSDNLPLGIFQRLDAEKKKYALNDANYVIMVSDGIVEGIGNEHLLCGLLEQLTIQNPQEMANYILQFVLHKTGGRIPDDMTVLVAGVWENIQGKSTH